MPLHLALLRFPAVTFSFPLWIFQQRRCLFPLQEAAGLDQLIHIKVRDGLPRSRWATTSHELCSNLLHSVYMITASIDNWCHGDSKSSPHKRASVKTVPEPILSLLIITEVNLLTFGSWRHKWQLSIKTPEWCHQQKYSDCFRLLQRTGREH